MADDDTRGHSEVLDSGSAEHPSHVLHYLRSFYQERSLCDVTLTAGNYTVQAHKVVLAANSDYFCAMFSGIWPDVEKDNIILHKLTPPGLKAVMEFSYHGKLTVDYDNIAEIVYAVHLCQIVKAYKPCEEYLEKSIDQFNFATLLKLSDTFNLDSLQKSLVAFAGKEILPSYFEDTESVLDELEPSSLNLILKSWDFSKLGFGQIAAFDLVVKWCEKNKKGSDLRDLLSAANRKDCDINDAVKYCQMTSYDRSQAARASGLSFVSFFFDHCYNRNNRTTSWTTSATACCVDGSTGSCWKDLPAYPASYSWPNSMGVAVLNGVLFVCGGLVKNCVSDACYKYDPCYDRWETIQPMRKVRKQFPLLAFENNLYALGGLSEHEQEPVGTVEVYDPTRNEWMCGVPLPHPVYDHAATVHNGMIYISGGRVGHVKTALKEIFCFDPRRNQWTQKQNMVRGRFEHGLAAHGHGLYQLGGRDVYESLTDSVRFHLKPIDDPMMEYYDVTTNTCIAVSRLPYCITPRALHSLKDSLYILGHKYVKSDNYIVVFQYNPEQKSITEYKWVTNKDKANMLLPLNFPTFVFEQMPQLQPYDPNQKK